MLFNGELLSFSLFNVMIKLYFSLSLQVRKWLKLRSMLLCKARRMKMAVWIMRVSSVPFIVSLHINHSKKCNNDWPFYRANRCLLSCNSKPASHGHFFNLFILNSFRQTHHVCVRSEETEAFLQIPCCQDIQTMFPKPTQKRIKGTRDVSHKQLFCNLCFQFFFFTWILFLLSILGIHLYFFQLVFLVMFLPGQASP